MFPGSCHASFQSLAVWQSSSGSWNEAIEHRTIYVLAICIDFIMMSCVCSLNIGHCTQMLQGQLAKRSDPTCCQPLSEDTLVRNSDLLLYNCADILSHNITVLCNTGLYNNCSVSGWSWILVSAINHTPCGGITSVKPRLLYRIFGYKTKSRIERLGWILNNHHTVQF